MCVVCCVRSIRHTQICTLNTVIIYIYRHTLWSKKSHTSGCCRDVVASPQPQTQTDRAMRYAFNRRPLTVDAWIQSQAILFGIYDWHSGNASATFTFRCDAALRLQSQAAVLAVRVFFASQDLAQQTLDSAVQGRVALGVLVASLHDSLQIDVQEAVLYIGSRPWKLKPTTRARRTADCDRAPHDFIKVSFRFCYWQHVK